MRTVVDQNEADISNELRRFWELEHMGIQTKDTVCDKVNDTIVREFEAKIKHNEDGRYEVHIPWKTSDPCLPRNKRTAEERLNSLTKRLLKNQHVMMEYDTTIRQYLNDGHAERVDIKANADGPVFYLPHRAVFRPDKASTKVRIVFDASSSASDCPSLNDCLEVGPNLNPDLLATILRFRKHSVAVTADIEKAFLQISLNPNDRDAFRFMWYTFMPESGRPLSEIEVWRMTRVPFGAASSPFLLAATLRYHFNLMSSTYPETYRKLTDGFYVDDFVTSVRSREEAEILHDEANKVLSAAGMHIRKWATNDSELQVSFRTKNKDNSQVKKVLGIVWNTTNDVLSPPMDSLDQFLTKKRDTKRCLLQVSARIYDPLGILSAYTVKAKILSQRAWELGIGWDDELPEHIGKEWQQRCKGIPFLPKITVPRAITDDDSVVSRSIHCFCDASQQAYGAVLHLRTVYEDGSINVVIVAAKSRVAPLKRVSLPRLELLGALVGARLTHHVTATLNYEGLTMRYWTDSTVVLHWVKGSASRWKPFVANRVTEIQSMCNPSDWHHCPGESNPADLLTRGVLPDMLMKDDFWWKGPEWLNNEEALWPKFEVDTLELPETTSREERKNATAMMATDAHVSTPLLTLENHSSLLTVLRITAWIKRFIHNCRQKDARISGPLNAAEIQSSLRQWIRQVQRESFPGELEILSSDKNTVGETSPLRTLSPYVDKDQIMRLRGRLQQRDAEAAVKHPIILPKDHDFTSKLITQEHLRLLHGGVRDTLVQLRESNWILRGRQAVKRAIHQCLTCRKWRSKPADEAMAPLPRDRVTEAEPFVVSGIDFAGPLFYKTETGSSKAYIVLFTCAVTRAVHLELVTDLTAATFLLTFRGFISRRGICHTVYTDNALTFKHASKDLKQLWTEMRGGEVQDYFSGTQITLKFIVERAAWWGGFWERMVRTVKTTLRKVLGTSSLTLDQLTTLLTEVEAMVNSRPISFVYSDSNEPDPLSPAHFLVGKHITRLSDQPTV
ncbi:uncharacterized protein LOC135384399 [Ornithodoros turicata]|uniref:uncharacterized protein LOC135384399 n=1 Tax=Ornithodoros turicata TaxID=34597 RepID=UPI0031386B2C